MAPAPGLALLFLALLHLAPLAYPLILAAPACRLTLEFSAWADGGWLVGAELECGGLAVSCRGPLEPSALVLQAKTISEALVVTSIHYVLARVCPRLLAPWPADPWTPVVLEIRAPPGYVVRTGLDWRGLGPLGGPYVAPYAVMALYLADGVVVARAGRYVVADDAGLRLSLVHDAEAAGAARAAEAVARVRSVALELLGPSPRAPSVVVVSAGDHPLMLPGTGHSTGAVVYVKLGGVTPPELVAAHEAAHAWLGSGLVYGEPAAVEGAAMLLASLALGADVVRRWARALDPYYLSWAEVHERMREAGLLACGVDVYSRALRGLIARALEGGPVELTLAGLARAMVAAAPEGCRCELVRLLGWVLTGERCDPRRAP